jgi:hypothetical protein
MRVFRKAELLFASESLPSMEAVAYINILFVKWKPIFQNEEAEKEMD